MQQPAVTGLHAVSAVFSSAIMHTVTQAVCPHWKKLLLLVSPGHMGRRPRTAHLCCCSVPTQAVPLCPTLELGPAQSATWTAQCCPGCSACSHRTHMPRTYEVANSENNHACEHRRTELQVIGPTHGSRRKTCEDGCRCSCAAGLTQANG